VSLKNWYLSIYKNNKPARHWWLTPIIPAAQEAEIRKIMVQRQPGQTVQEDPISKEPITKKGLVECLKV
jgi:hypothetical protein